MQKESTSSFATFSHQAVDFILGKSEFCYYTSIMNPTTKLSYAYGVIQRDLNQEIISTN